jgi:hypothetical protein
MKNQTTINLLWQGAPNEFPNGYLKLDHRTWNGIMQVIRSLQALKLS